MLEFKERSAQAGTLKSLGTVAENAGVGGYHELASIKNFKGSVKENGKLTNVTIAIVNKDNKIAYVNCSGPVSTDLRTAKSVDEAKAKVAALVNYPILELPQLDEDGEPVMVMNEETGKEEPLVLRSISFPAGADMSATRVMITPAMIKAEAVKRTIDWNDLVAL